MIGRKSISGLTLIEMMLAILGLSLLLSVILASISADLRAERNADLRATAIRIASSEMATARMTEFDELEALSHQEIVDVSGKEYSLRTVVTRDSGFPNDIRTVVITITWKDGARHLQYDSKLIKSRL